MKEASERKRKRSRLPKLAVLGGLFLIIVLVIYGMTGENMITYYYEDDADMRLVSVTPSGIDGVSCDTTIVLEWNHPVSVDLIDAVSLRPSARGEWYVSGNYLMFTPQQLAAGEYYTVSIPKGTVLNNEGDTLQESIFFAFETEDSDLRIPDTKAFDTDGHFFRFSDKESVVVPVAMVGDEKTVDVMVYRAEDSEAFINTFSELNAYPAWAHLSIDAFRGDLKGFDKVSETSMDVRETKGKSGIDLGSLPEGQYLVRFESGKDSRDVAVTVSASDVGTYVENGVLALWSHKDGVPNEGAEIEFNGNTYTLDENGYISLPCKITQHYAYREPSSLAVTVKDAGGEMVHFITMEDLNDTYRCDLILNKPNMVSGNTLVLSGSLFTQSGAAVNGEGEIRLISSAETVLSKEVSIENGYFTLSWDDFSLTDGSYQFILNYDGMDVASENLVVGSEDHELNILVEKSDDAVFSGETVTYTATVTDQKGRPVTDALVSVNGEDGVAVDENGSVKIKKTYYLTDGLASVQKDAYFTVISDYGDAAEAVSSVSVVSSRKNRIQDRSESVTVQKETLPLIHGEDSFDLLSEGQTATLEMTYYDHTYGISVPSSTPVFSLPASVDVGMGELISLNADFGEGGYRVAMVSLCSGRIPDGLCGKIYTDEFFGEHAFGTLEENRVFFGGESVNAVFSTENRDGDYYIRVAVKSPDNSVSVGYVPVSVNGVTVTCPKEQSVFSGHHASLSFGLNTDESLDYVLSVGDRTYNGTTKENFSVAVSELATGQYHGVMRILSGDAVVASRDFDFEVTNRTPMFTAVEEGIHENAIATYQVKEGTEEAFISAYEILALPGDQILQRMGHALFYDTFGLSLSGDLSYSNFDLSSLQNPDGSFGRYIGAQGDILLSVFVAEREEFICDRDSLCAYLKYRLTTADNPETAALACWGLSCFGVDCSESMDIIRNGKVSSDRTYIYLAEGYYAAGNKVYAEKLYDEFADQLVESDGTLHMPEADDQYNIANTAFMLDLSQKLDRGETDGLLLFLMDSDIQVQSGRYLFLSGLLHSLDKKDIAPMRDGVVKNGYTALSVFGADLGEVPAVTTSFSVKGETVTSVNQGSVAEINIYWEASPNSIYLIYADEGSSTSIIEKDGLRKRRGYYEYVTANGTASVSFKASTVGDHVSPTVYVIDLTTGKLVGRSDESGLKVIK